MKNKKDTGRPAAYGCSYCQVRAFWAFPPVPRVIP